MVRVAVVLGILVLFMMVYSALSNVNHLTGFVVDETNVSTSESEVYADYGAFAEEEPAVEVEYETSESDGGEASYGVMAGSCPAGMSGSNTTLDPCLVTNCTQLQNMSLDLSNHYALANDIDCSATLIWNSGKGFNPIGCGGSNCGTRPTSAYFTGTFNGKNHTISNLFINRTSEYNVGLFGHISGANIINVGLVNVSVSGDQYTGGLVSSNYVSSTISNSYSTGNVTGITYTGGLVGDNYDATISNSYSTGSVNGYASTGGLVSSNSAGTISNSYSTGNVTGIGSYTGGLVGYNFNLGTITNSYSTGSVNGGASTGGLVGQNYATISNCYWNNHEGDPFDCYNGGNTGCTAIQDNESYFFDASNEPMASWSYPPWDDFCNASGYPSLEWENITNVLECRGFVPTNDANYTEYSGDTTIFNAHPTPWNVPNATLERVGKGKIVWNVNVNATGANFDAYVEISSNYIFVNTSALHESFNGSATLTLDNLDFSTAPIVQVDPEDDGSFVECNATTDPECHIVSWNGSTLVFNVSHFTGYQAAESGDLPNCTVSCGSTINDSCQMNESLKNSTGGTECSGNGIIIGADDVTLDCDGYSMTSDGSPVDGENGIYVGGRDNVTIKNCAVYGFYMGIFIEFSANSLFEANQANDNAHHGFYIDSADYNNFSSNEANNNPDRGFYIAFYNDNNDFINNTAADNSNYGFYIGGACNSNTFLNNIAEYNPGYGFFVYFSNYNNFTSNEAIYNSYDGVYVYYSYDNTFFNNTAANNGAGFSISISLDNIFASNRAVGNLQYGYYIDNANNNNFTSNIAEYNGHSGFSFQSSSTGNIVNNTYACYNNQSGPGYYDIRDDDANDFSENTCNTSIGMACEYLCSRELPGGGLNYTFEPYVMAWNETAEIVRFETQFASNATVEYGETTSYGSSVSNLTFLTQHEIVITGLNPGTKYYYKVTAVNVSGGSTYENSSFNSSFVVSNNSLDSFVFAVVGDTRSDTDCDIGPITPDVMRNISAMGADFVITTGDMVNANDGGCDYNSTWKVFHNATEIIRKNTSMLDSPGNHENIHVAWAMDAYKQYWIHPLNGDGASGEWNETTYTWRYGNSLFISVNTYENGNEGDVAGTQFTWFNETALTQQGYTHKFVFTHYPLVGSSRGGTLYADDPSRSAMIDNEMFTKNVTAAFYGHDHYYCLNTTNNGEMIHVIAGGGGAPLYSSSTCLGTGIQQYHYVIVNVTGRAINGTAYNLSGDAINTFSRFMNDGPSMSSVLVNSSDGTNGTNKNLTCWANAADPDLDNVSYSGWWYKNGVQDAVFNTSSDYDSGVIVNVSTLDSSSTSEGDNWSCYVRAYDGTEYSGYLMSENLTVLQTPDTTEPSFSNAVNTSSDFRNGSTFIANITIDDDRELASYIFSTNASGAWANTTAASISGMQYNVSETDTIEAGDGSEICWYYWANDTSGNNGTSVMHCFNSASKTNNAAYSGFDGDTTDFNYHPTPWSISGATLEVSGSGKIMWTGNVNATGADFDSYVQISDNYIYLNSSALHSSFNSSANITLYGLSLTEPIKIMVDINDSGTYAECSNTTDPECHIISYTSGTLIFNVSHFTAYKTEGYVPATPSGGGGGGRTYDACEAGNVYCVDIYTKGVCEYSVGMGSWQWSSYSCGEGEECQNGICTATACSEDWICNDWERCVIGTQARNCIDWNECGTEYLKPSVSKECPYEEPVEEKPAPFVPVVIAPPRQEPKPFISAKMLSMLSYVFGMLVLLAVTILLASYYVHKYGPGWAMARGIREGTPEKDLLRIVMEKGLAEKSARQLLRDKEVKRLREIIVKNIRLGYDTFEIKSHLLAKGWRRSLIDEAFGVKKAN